MEDFELVTRVRTLGDEAAFELIVHRHYQLLWRDAQALLGNPEEAEEAVSKAFEKAFRRLDQYRGDASLSTWLVSICRNCCKDLLRSRKDLSRIFPLEVLENRKPVAEDSFPSQHE